MCFNNVGISHLTQDKILQFETNPHSVMQEILATLYWGNTTNKSSIHTLCMLQLSGTAVDMFLVTNQSQILVYFIFYFKLLYLLYWIILYVVTFQSSVVLRWLIQELSLTWTFQLFYTWKLFFFPKLIYVVVFWNTLPSKIENYSKLILWQILGYIN